MRGKVAKAIRKQVYGDFSPRFRKYFKVKKTEQKVSDEKRQLYQLTKKVYNG